MEVVKDDIPYDLHTMVDIVGINNFLEICKMYGGTNIYIPVHKKVILGKRNREIIKEYNGKNIDILRIKHGICRQQLKNLLKEGGAL
ncbi:Mor transcription activator family protein [Terrisporobacter vanillatitrophus]|uniref:Mor transcription activator family protein n=1 Tax=Terrisporobacter vanillatitrophus TaxID=3058402 RepID=UPI003368403C